VNNRRDDLRLVDAALRDQTRRRAGRSPLEGHPELKAVLARAVTDVVTAHPPELERDASLLERMERAAAAAALPVYQGLVESAAQASDEADRALRDQARAVVATGEVTAVRVTDAAVALHDVEEGSAERVAEVAARAAVELASSVGPNDEIAAADAAALTITAVGEAAALRVSARAEAASATISAAAGAAAELAEEAAVHASQAEVDAITDDTDRQQNALRTCYEVAVATAEAVFADGSASCRTGGWPGRP
jgi:hypothetical protein